MRALLFDRFGDPPRLGELPDPAPGPGEVRVRQAWSSISAGDRLMGAGRPWLLRPAFWAALRPPVLGRDVAGVVEAVGPGVLGFGPGDRVVGEAGAAWAERVCVPVARLARVPDGVPLRAVGALPVAGCAALQGLRPEGLRDGACVLILGASSAVGAIALQLAAAAGAEAWGACRPSAADRVRGLGAAGVIAPDPRAWGSGPPGVKRGWDLILDLHGTAPLGALRAPLSPAGACVSSAGELGGAWLGPLPRFAAFALTGLIDRRMRVLASAATAADLTTLVDAVAAGRLRVPLGATLEPDEVGPRWGERPEGRTLIRFSADEPEISEHGAS